ncbi:MAG: type II secretion system protein [Campylobacterota bacterium]|nr:type II secretion system protein [Campylobacterota bacterium]
MNYKNNRLAFSLLELIFVIAIIGILGKFGASFLAQAYSDFIYSKINNSLQAQSEMAVETVAKRLQFRIKDSIIRRKSSDNSFVALGDIDNYGDEYNILEWVGSDIDGYRGDSLPLWSGVIDLDRSSATTLNSPETNTTAINNLINSLSYDNSDINDSAIYFIGSDTDINGYGWNGVALGEHNSSVMHPIKSNSNINEFESGIAGIDFSGVDIYEYYQLSWSAYAVEHNATTKELKLYYDYQPWAGEGFKNGKSATIMEDVSTFRFKAVGSIVKIQVCVKSDIIDGETKGDYSLCKEKTIF